MYDLQLLVRDLTSALPYQDLYNRKPLSQNLKTLGADQDVLRCSLAVVECNRERKDSSSSADTTPRTCHPSLYSDSRCLEHEVKKTSVSVNVSHRCASSVIPKNSTPLTSKPMSTSITSPSKRFASKISSLLAENESSSSLKSQVEFVEQDTIQQPLKKRMKRESALPKLIISKGEELSSMSSKNQFIQEKNLAPFPRDTSVVKENESDNREFDILNRRVEVSDKGNKSKAIIDLAASTDFERQNSNGPLAQKDATHRNESDISNCQEPNHDDFNKSLKTRPVSCANPFSNGAPMLISGSEAPGVKPNPCTTSMVLTNINGMLLSLPAGPTIQVIVVNNYPTNDAVLSQTSHLDGNRLCAIAAAPPTMASNAGVSLNKDLNGRLLMSNRHRMYKCDHANCNKTYLKNSHLKVHQRIHTGIMHFSRLCFNLVNFLMKL